MYSPFSGVVLYLVTLNLSLHGIFVAEFDGRLSFGDGRANVASFETTLTAKKALS